MTQKTTPLDLESLAALASADEPPYLSLYQPTHRRHPENKQDRIRFRNLVKEMEGSLRQAFPTLEAQQLLKPFEELEQDELFWDHTQDGLAVLAGPLFFRVFLLPIPVEELVVVADSFHTKPLRRFLQSVDRYQVLGLSLRAVRLFEGNRHGLGEVELGAGVPRTIEEALGAELTEPHQTVASYGGVGGGSSAMHHGHGGKTDEVEIDAARFFRAVDRAVQDHQSRPSGLPLILAALPEHHHLFHEVSQNPLLVADGIRLNPDAVSADELGTLAWQVMEPAYLARLASLGEEFEKARSRDAGSDDLEKVAEASAHGRVATLLIEADREIAGALDGATGAVSFTPLGDTGGDDLLDDLGELVVKMGGNLFVIPAERMPTTTGLAATYRY
ncbi:MAG: baeRF3 domain-containing protein [Thermoanaerobaculia bacterium]